MPEIEDINLAFPELTINDYPVGTQFIDTDGTGEYWELVFPGILRSVEPHCEACIEYVFTKEADETLRPSLTAEALNVYEFDDYENFKRYTVHSLPMAVTNFLMMELFLATGSVVQYSEALKAVKDAQAQKKA